MEEERMDIGVETGNENEKDKQNQTKEKPKNQVFLVVLVVVILAVGGAWYYLEAKDKETAKKETKTKTANNISTSTTIPTNSFTSSDNSSQTASQLKTPSGYITVEKIDNKQVFFRYDLNGNKTEIFNTVLAQGPCIGGDYLTDGEKIVYCDNYDIKIYDIKTKETKVVINKISVVKDGTYKNIGNLKDYSAPIFSPNGKYIGAKLLGWEWSSVATVNSDGSNLNNLPNDCSKDDIAWSHDSSKSIAAGSNSDMGGEQACLYIADSSNPSAGKNILQGDISKKYPDTFKDVYTPTFSPNDSKVAFGYRYLDVNQEGGQRRADASNYRGIYIINTDGTNFKQITDNRSFSSTPFWLDNETILYGLSNFHSGTKKGLYSIKLDGNGNTELYSGQFNRYDIISVSKDKRFITYMAWDYKENTHPTDDAKTLYLYDLQTRSNKEIGKTVSNSMKFIGWVVD